MHPRLVRHPANPIVRPGLFPWRQAVTFNPGVIFENGRFYMAERAAAGLRPFHCSIGMLASENGVSFKHLSDQPVFTPEMAGSRYGSVQDPRLTKLDGRFWMTFAYRPFAWSCDPTGVGVPESRQESYPGFSGRPEDNQTRSGLAVSDDLEHWEFFGWVTPPEIDDRDVVLFPEKVGGRYAALRRPISFVSTDTGHGQELPAISISFSDGLRQWSAPLPVARPEFSWESNRIGASAPPLRTDRGWLLLYHGVETIDPVVRHVRYRLGVMILDLQDPRKVIGRPKDFIMEPEEYYEKQGLLIPDVIFPTAAVVRDGTVWIYYGVCDTAIALATVKLEELIQYAMKG